jgi:glutamyl/glutaminyl-tRNA synthetase
MHIGTARTAYFNWLAAKSTGGTFTLRIDDTNKETTNSAYTEVIVKTMDWLGLSYDRWIRQSDRFGTYEREATMLVCHEKAEILDNNAIALTEVNLPDTWHDEVGGDINISDDDREKAKGMILIRGDGSPTYHFANVVDDMELGINCVIRGVDHISNTPRQIAIYNAFKSIYPDATVPMYAHVGLIHQNKKKLSKRDGSASMLFYKDKGYDPDAMLNFLLRLGWGPKVDDKTASVIDRDRAIELFLTGGNMQAGQAAMDPAKLESYDRKYKARKGIWRTGQKLLT